MFVCFNGQIFPEEKFFLDYRDRAFQYGDRLFETMIFRNGQITFLDDHIDRLHRGMRQLEYAGIETITANVVETAALALVAANGYTQQARIKLIVWRKEGGRYTPTTNDIHFLLVSEPHATTEKKIDARVGICQTTKIFPHALSSFKCYSLPYVIAGIEKAQRKWDDIILLNHKNEVGECLVSNLFWKKDEVIFTPSLRTGCIDGVFRKNLLRFFKKIGQSYREVKAPLEEVLSAQHVFTTNVAGIRQILSIGERSYTLLPEIDHWEKILLGNEK